MEYLNSNKKNSNDIYYYQASKEKIYTEKEFTITKESGKLRVKNENVNYIFNKLTPKSFDKIYNDFIKHLNLDFSPVKIGEKSYSLTTKQQNLLEQQIILYIIYLYTIHNQKVQIKRSDFESPCLLDSVLHLLDKKYKKDTTVALTLGARILRQDFDNYCSSVKARRIFYDR